MATPSNVVRVPKPAASSFNKNRPISKNKLIENQVKHFREVEKTLPPEQQTGMDFDKIATEGQAAEYIGKLTKFLRGTPRTAGGK
jgi:hypothetical protein